MNLKVVTRNVGLALLLNALFMFISAIVSAIYGYDASFSPLLLSAIITTIAGSFPLIFVTRFYDITIREGFTIVVSSWILSCLFGMLPYVLYGGEFSIVNAWFESVSGYTTTGATILKNVEGIPNGLLFWRSSTHWLGGVGVVLFMLLILPTVSTFRMRLSKMEISSLSKENFKFKAYQTIRVIAIVYVGLTVLGIIFLCIAGMNLFDAVNHSFATVATGGFSTKNLSVLHYNSVWIEIVLMVFMFLAGAHFGLLYSVIAGKPGSFFKSSVIKFYFYSILLGCLVLSLYLKFTGTVDEWGLALRQGFFQVVSLGTTTGFANADSSGWPPFAILILIYFCFQCACSGSTTGGIKVDRVLIFFKSLRVQLKKQIHPNAILPIKVDSHIIDKELVYNVNLYIGLYILIVFLATVFISILNVSLIDSFTASVACMGNVGPGFGTVGSLGNYSHFPDLAKLILSFEMLLGRLEIYSLLILLVIYRKS